MDDWQKLSKLDEDALDEMFVAFRAAIPLLREAGCFREAYILSKLNTQVAIAANMVAARVARNSQAQLSLVPPPFDQDAG